MLHILEHQHAFVRNGVDECTNIPAVPRPMVYVDSRFPVLRNFFQDYGGLVAIDSPGIQQMMVSQRVRDRNGTKYTIPLLTRHDIPVPADGVCLKNVNKTVRTAGLSDDFAFKRG